MTNINKFISKYPKIIYDQTNNSPNMSTANLTVEQLYDLMHHTHKIEDIIGIYDPEEQSEIIEEINSINKKIEDIINDIGTVDSKYATKNDLDSIIQPINSKLDLPTIGDSHKIYITDNNILYRWNDNDLKYYSIGDYSQIKIIDAS